jgi:hypothetical protein
MYLTVKFDNQTVDLQVLTKYKTGVIFPHSAASVTGYIVNLLYMLAVQNLEI